MTTLPPDIVVAPQPQNSFGTFNVLRPIVQEGTNVIEIGDINFEKDFS